MEAYEKNPEFVRRVKEQLDKVISGESDFETIAQVSPKLFRYILGSDQYKPLKVDYYEDSQRLEARLPSNFANAFYQIMFKSLETKHVKLPQPEYYGRATVRLSLSNTHKTPDFSFYDPRIASKGPGISSIDAARRNSSPTVVWEVAPTEKSRRLGRDCAFWLATSDCYVHLAIGITVSYNESEKQLQSIGVSEWRIINYVDPEALERKECYKLRRTDGLDDKSAPSLADSYKFSLPVKEKGFARTWTVARTYKEIYGPNATQPVEGEICLRIGHVFRDAPEGFTGKDTYGTISYQSIVDAYKIMIYRQLV